MMTTETATATSIIDFFFAFGLFVLFTPGVLVSIPGNSISRVLTALIHAVLFTVVLGAVLGGITYLSAPPAPAPTSVPTPACPPGQQWVSGSNPRNGYCSIYSQAALLSDHPPVHPAPSLWYQASASASAPAPSPSCPSGQQWISGSNPRHGQCSTMTLAAALNGSVASPTYNSPVVHTCPPGQNWVSGTNPHHGYCSTMTTSQVVSESAMPTHSGLFGWNPLQLPQNMIVN